MEVDVYKDKLKKAYLKLYCCDGKCSCYKECSKITHDKNFEWSCIMSAK